LLLLFSKLILFLVLSLELLNLPVFLKVGLLGLEQLLDSLSLPLPVLLTLLLHLLDKTHLLRLELLDFSLQCLDLDLIGCLLLVQCLLISLLLLSISKLVFQVLQLLPESFF
jgi:hypothetical protein